MNLLQLLGLLVSVSVLLPMSLIGFSSRVSGWAKAGWVVVTMLLSWLGFALFLLMTGYRQASHNEHRRSS